MTIVSEADQATTGGRRRRVFISHTTADDAAAARLATTLRQAGIEAFNDGWEVQGGHDFVAWINRRLDECDAGVIVFSPNTADKPWMKAEISALMYMRVSEGKQLIPVLIPGDDGKLPVLPPLMRPLSRFGIDQVQAVIDQLLNPVAPRPVGVRDGIRVHRVVVSLQNEALAESPGLGQMIRARVTLDDRTINETVLDGLPRSIVQDHRRFLEGFRHAIQRNPARAEAETRE